MLSLSKLYIMKKKIPISIVCASHNGAKKLPNLVRSVFYNTEWPIELIIVHTKPSDLFFIDKQYYKKLNIKTHLSKIKNQVIQRKKGILHASSDLVLQIDDDNILEKRFISNIYKNFLGTFPNKKIISAKINNKNILQSSRWNDAYYNSFFFRICLRLLNFGKSIKYMSITHSGRICPLVPKQFYKSSIKLKNLEWTCSTICYHKKNFHFGYLNLNFKKKSFFEDVFFTHSLFLKGFQLLIDPKIIAYHPPTKPLDLKVFFDTISSQYKIIKKFKKSYFLFIIDFLIFSSFFILKKIKDKIK